MQDSAEAAFQEFITRVEPAHSAFEKTLTRGLADRARWSVTDQPGRMLVELAVAATIPFLAGLSVIRDAIRAFAAEVFIRSELEYMANVAFVTGHDSVHPRGTPEQRAACLGVAHARELAAFSGRLEVAPGQPMSNPDDLVNRAAALHDRVGCAFPGRGRWLCRSGYTHSMVKFTLGRLQRPEIPEQVRIPSYVVAIFEATSLSTHLLGLGRFLLPDPKTGGIVFTPANLQLRAYYVEALLFGIARGMQWTLDLLVPGVERPFADWWEQVQNDPVYAEAKAGIIGES